MLDANLNVDGRDLEALRRAQAEGIVVVACTGRPFPGALPWVEKLGLTDPFVCYQGAQVRTPAGAVLLDHGIAHALAMEVVRFCRERDVHVHGYVEDRLVVEKDRPEARAYATHSGMQIHVVGDLDRALGITTPKLVVVAAAEEVERLLPVVQRQWHERLFATTSLPTYLEMTNPDADKRQALDFLARRLGIRREDAIAVGDGRNDAPMLEWAGLGVAIEGAPPEVLKVAERVIPGPGHGGIAALVESLLKG